MEEKGFMGRLFDLSFSEFITTKIIKMLFVLAIVGSAIGALTVLGTMLAQDSFMAKLAGLVLAPIVFLVYVILARVWMELIIVVFRIAENTAKIAGRENP